jgi:hypothetical protein
VALGNGDGNAVGNSVGNVVGHAEGSGVGKGVGAGVSEKLKLPENAEKAEPWQATGSRNFAPE